MPLVTKLVTRYSSALDYVVFTPTGKCKLNSIFCTHPVIHQAAADLGTVLAASQPSTATDDCIHICQSLLHISVPVTVTSALTAVCRHTGASAEASFGHAVVLAGYSNTGKYWIVRSSWGPKVGTDGYFKVAYGASGLADASNTWGLRFEPVGTNPAYAVSQVSPAAKKGCYNYKAAGDDYFSRVAYKFGVSVKQLLLDNLGEVKDPTSPLGSTTLLVCGAANVRTYFHHHHKPRHCSGSRLLLTAATTSQHG